MDELLDRLASLVAGTGDSIRDLLEKIAPIVSPNSQILLLSPRAEQIQKDWPKDLNLPPIRIVESSRKQLEPLFDWTQSGA